MRDAFGVEREEISKGVKDLPKFLPKGKETTQAIKLRAHRATNEGNMDARLRGFGQTKVHKAEGYGWTSKEAQKREAKRTSREASPFRSSEYRRENAKNVAVGAAVGAPLGAALGGAWGSELGRKGAITGAGIGGVVGAAAGADSGHGYAYNRSQQRAVKRGLKSKDIKWSKNVSPWSGRIQKAWKGEPGDKRNTKYGIATAAGLPLAPIGLAIPVGYAAYRASDRSKAARAASVKARKRELRVSKAFLPAQDLKAAAIEGAVVGGAVGIPSAFIARKKAKEKKAGIKKAWKGEQGDKRNTKYAAAGLGASYAGAELGHRAGARAVGTTAKEMGAKRGEAFLRAFENGEGVHGEDVRSTPMGAWRASGKVKGVKAARIGRRIGGLTAGAAAVGGYAAYRHNKNSAKA